MLNFSEPMSRSALARALGIGRVTLYRYEKAGIIPPADRVSHNRALFSPAAQLAVAAIVEARS